MVTPPTETKGPAPWRSLARPGGPLYSRLVFPTGTKGPPLVPGVKPGLKEGTFSPGLVLPVGKLGLKGFPNQEQKALLHQCRLGMGVESGLVACMYICLGLTRWVTYTCLSQIHAYPFICTYRKNVGQAEG